MHQLQRGLGRLWRSGYNNDNLEERRRGHRLIAGSTREREIERERGERGERERE